MGFQDVNPYGDPDEDVVIDISWGPPITLPGENRDYEKVTGRIVEMKLQLSNLGTYTEGGYDLAVVRNEIGCESITGLFTNNSFDPYGDAVVPLGVELKLYVPTLSTDIGNLYSTDSDAVDFTLATLQVWENAAEVTDGVWVAGATETPWVLAFVR